MQPVLRDMIRLVLSTWNIVNHSTFEMASPRDSLCPEWVECYYAERRRKWGGGCLLEVSATGAAAQPIWVSHSSVKIAAVKERE